MKIVRNAATMKLVALRGFPRLAALPLVATFAALPFAAVEAAGSAAAGKEKAVTCNACHGEDGVALQPSYPNLAGQYPSYIEHALRAYRSGTRENAIMYGFASQLSDQDIEDLAAWFASMPGTLQTAPRP